MNLKPKQGQKNTYLDPVWVVPNRDFHVEPSLQAPDDQPEVDVADGHHDQEEDGDDRQRQPELTENSNVDEFTTYLGHKRNIF